MQIWRIHFHWVLIPGIIFPIVALGGFEGFRANALPNLVPQPVLQRVAHRAYQPVAAPPAAAPQPAAPQPAAVQPPAPAQPQISPAGELEGSWTGIAQYIYHLNGNTDFCIYSFAVDLTITNQTGNNIVGNVTVTEQKSQQYGNFACNPQAATNDAVTGTISSSAININAGNQGNFTGSFTSRTMALNQPKDNDGDGLNAPLNLLLQ